MWCRTFPYPLIADNPYSTTVLVLLGYIVAVTQRRELATGGASDMVNMVNIR